MVYENYLTVSVLAFEREFEILDDIERLQSSIRTIRSTKGRTNIFFTTTELKDLFQTKPVQISIQSESVVFGYPDEGEIWRIYFYCREVDALSSIKKSIGEIPKGYTVVCDIVGKEPGLSLFSAEMKKIGYCKYARFQRMTCRKWILDLEVDISAVEIAVMNDVDEILQMLYETFDPITAHFPARKEICDWITDEEVLVVRDPPTDRIAGLAVFKSKNKRMACLNYFIVRKEFQGKGIARRMLYYKMYHCNYSDSYYIWINDECAGAIAMYEKFHFHKDGLFDDIFKL